MNKTSIEYLDFTSNPIVGCDMSLPCAERCWARRIAHRLKSAGVRQYQDVEVKDLTPRQLEILQHALGVDQYGQGRMYRNHYCAGGSDADTCRELVELGYMRNHPTTEMYPYYNCTVTEEGKQAVNDQSPKSPKLTRSQWRYREFLHADTGASFGEWLKWTTGRQRERHS